MVGGFALRVFWYWCGWPSGYVGGAGHLPANDLVVKARREQVAPLGGHVTLR